MKEKKSSNSRPETNKQLQSYTGSVWLYVQWIKRWSDVSEAAERCNRFKIAWLPESKDTSKSCHPEESWLSGGVPPDTWLEYVRKKTNKTTTKNPEKPWKDILFVSHRTLSKKWQLPDWPGDVWGVRVMNIQLVFFSSSSLSPPFLYLDMLRALWASQCLWTGGTSCDSCWRTHQVQVWGCLSHVHCPLK